jgi:hypothetical protein
MNYRISTPLDIDQVVRPGDILAYSGRGLISETVRLATNSDVSHIGIVLTAGPVSTVIESTSLAGFSGVTIGPLAERCTNYNGEVWFLPLADRSLGLTTTTKLQAWLQAQNHDKYDTWGAIESALQLHHPKHVGQWFCSELAAAALQSIGLLSGSLVPDQVRPCDLVRMPIFSPDYWQIQGEVKSLCI